MIDLKNLFNDNEVIVKKLQKFVDQINDLELNIKQLSDTELKGKTAEFKDSLSNGSTLNDILPEAFAVVREASRRVLGMRHFDVQLIGGIVLHQGRIAEMKTGEGKTLVATLPSYLNALTGRGVHVVTVNEYLARRDSEWVGQVHRFLGLSVGLVVHDMSYSQRKTAYNADITYGTNNEFGFDYLRDNMVFNKEQMVQRDLHYAIVDEIDSILIDEARTPLIISGEGEKAKDTYYMMSKVVPKLVREQDYSIDEKAHSVALTEEGVAKAEQLLGVLNLYDDENIELNHHLNQALKAHALMKSDRDYVVKDGEVIIVDQFTGRLMVGRRYNEGLHQAIEAKEGVKIERESRTLATITFQNYFRMYEKLSGMTGTALTEEDEFRKIYGLDVVVIPTNKPVQRKDLSDKVFKTEAAKFAAVVEEIVEQHKKGQPVLVGTVSIEKSEELSWMLKRLGVRHKVLNAKYHEKEAEIVAQAGRLGAVTIATNMAGRGTDILLGGNPEFLARAQVSKTNGDEIDKEEFEKIYQTIKAQTDAEHDKVAALGGLHVIGTERHESRRIDNQLRGRAGRQGDPGSSRFYISLEDSLMRMFGSENISSMMDKLGMDEDIPIENPLVTKSIESAQKRVENRSFEIRKHVLEYDDVMNQQREVIYQQRKKVLAEDNLRETILEMIDRLIEDAMELYCNKEVHPEDWDLAGLLKHAQDLYLSQHELTPEDFTDMGRQALKEMLLEKSVDLYNIREQELGEETLRQIEKGILLRVVDGKWMDHLDAMDQLRQGIGLRAIGQKNPLVEYKFEGYEMFQNMISGIREDVVRHIFRARIVS